MSNFTPKSVSQICICQWICSLERKCVNTVISVEIKRQSMHAHAYSILRVYRKTHTTAHQHNTCFGRPKTRFIMSYLLTIEVLAANIGLWRPCFGLRPFVEIGLYFLQRNIVSLIEVRM